MARSRRVPKAWKTSKLPDPLAGWAVVLIDALASAGVTDIVATPGRSALPYFLAAKREPRLRLHHVLDERAAAFFALGQARVTDRPTAVMCTGGTAGAHFFPAVIEAAMAYVPLLLVTCDRPLDEKDCGLHQSIDQTRLFGGYARRFVELGIPDGHPHSIRGLRRAVLQAVHATAWPTPGPVQINARSRSPRVPDWDALPAASAELLQRPRTAAPLPVVTADPGAVAEVANACRATSRGVIVAGPAPLAQASARAAVGELSALTGFPVLASATSQLRFGGPPGFGGYDVFLGSPAWRAKLAPELILQLGAASMSASFGEYEVTSNAQRIVVAPHGWPDLWGTAAKVIACEPSAFVPALVTALAAKPPRPERAWQAAFAKADRAAWKIVDENLDAHAFSEGGATRELVAALPPGSLLVIGNSMAVRHLDYFCPGKLAEVGVVSQRGASGIDGLIAGTAGTATAAQKPVTLLLGDVSFLHDVGGLATARELATPLVIVVFHNDGGRIAELSSAGATAGDAGALTVFSHGIADLGPSAQLFGHRYKRVATQRALRAALTAAYRTAGCSIIQVDVPPHGIAEQYRALWSAIERVG